MPRHTLPVGRNHRRDITTFLCHCAIQRSARAVFSALSRHAVVVLQIPEDFPPQRTERIVAELLSIDDLPFDSQDDRPTLINFLYETSDAFKGRSLSPADRVEYLLADAPIAIVLIREAQEMPSALQIAADIVVRINRPTARHAQAAARLMMHVNLSDAEATAVAAEPLNLVSKAIKRGRDATRILEIIQKMKAAIPAGPIRQGPTLDDLHGLGSAGIWGRELATDLADWKAGRIEWRDVDHGVLLVGPPGTGKTTFAKALAATCQVPLIVGSYARWQASGHLGEMLGAMHKTFDEARKRVPCVLFLDEFDSIGDRRRVNDRNSEYDRKVVNAVLEALDGVRGREGVVVVGACNDAMAVDPALLRPGRMDRVIAVPLPDAAARTAILNSLIGEDVIDIASTDIPERTDGYSGADLGRLVRDARRLARRARRPICPDDLLETLPPRIPIPEEMRSRTAVHEAGHAVVAAVLGHGTIVSITLEKHFNGRDNRGGGTILQFPRYTTRGRKFHLDDICVSLAGLASEIVVFGDAGDGSGGVPGSDLQHATLTALKLEATWGLGVGLSMLATSDDPGLLNLIRTDRSLRNRVDALLSKQLSRAIEIISRHQAAIQRIANHLVTDWSISGADLSDLLDAIGIENSHKISDPTDTGQQPLFASFMDNHNAINYPLRPRRINDGPISVPLREHLTADCRSTGQKGG